MCTVYVFWIVCWDNINNTSEYSGSGSYISLKNIGKLLYSFDIFKNSSRDWTCNPCLWVKQWVYTRPDRPVNNSRPSAWQPRLIPFSPSCVPGSFHGWLEALPFFCHTETLSTHNTHSSLHQAVQASLPQPHSTYLLCYYNTPAVLYLGPTLLLWFSLVWLAGHGDSVGSEWWGS